MNDLFIDLSKYRITNNTLTYLFYFKFQVNVEAEYSGPRPSLNGSILQCPYELSSFHFHWGTKHDDGSEHRIMGKW